MVVDHGLCANRTLQQKKAMPTALITYDANYLEMVIDLAKRLMALL